MILKKYLNKKKYPGFLDLQNHFPFFLDQLVNDVELSDDLKFECLDSICSNSIKTKDELNTICCDFFDSRKLIGTICKNADKQNSYIRVNGKDSLVGWISQIVGLTTAQVNSLISTILYSSNLTLKTGLVNKLLNIEAVNDSYFDSKKCLKYFGMKKWVRKSKPTLKDAFLTNYNYIQWSFPDSKTEDLFRNQATIDILPCRAGLVFAEEKLLFTHNLNDNYNVRKPTVFDARLYPQFQPGGLTKPLTSCSHLKGFMEYVHIPNNFKNIASFKAETFVSVPENRTG